MKKLICSIVAACALVGFAAPERSTDQALIDLASTPIEKITAQNAMDVVNAAVAVGSRGKIEKCIDAGFLTYDQAYALSKKNKDSAWMYYFASASSNATLRATFIDDQLAIEKTYSVDDFSTLQYLYGALLNFKAPYSKRIEVAQQLIAAGLPTHAIQPLLGYLTSRRMFVKHDPEIYNAEYVEYCASVADQLLEAWIAQPPIPCKNAYGVRQPYLTGVDIVLYFSMFDDEKFERCLPKCLKYAEAGYPVYVTSSDFRNFSIKMAEAHIAAGKLPDNMLIKSASYLDKYYKNKNATATVYEKIKDPELKIQLAVNLADNDKLIDALLNTPASVSAKTIESALPMLVDMPVGFREADMLQALKTINKRCTLKLYDDRDTWEPILSKIRAMIDVNN